MNDTFDLFKATGEIADICIKDKLIQVFNIGLKLLSVVMNEQVCGGDIPRKVIEGLALKFIPILIDKYCDYAFKAKDKTVGALKKLLDHPFIGIGHSIDYIMTIGAPPGI